MTGDTFKLTCVRKFILLRLRYKDTYPITLLWVFNYYEQL